VLFALAAAVCYAVHAASNKYLLNAWPRPLGFVLLVMALEGAFALPVALLTGGIEWVSPVAVNFLATATFIFVANIFVFDAYEREDASITGPILGLKVVILAVLESVMGLKPVGPGIWAGAFLATAGVVLLCQTGRWIPRLGTLIRPGIGLVALGAFLYAFADLNANRALVAWGSGLAFGLHVNMATGLVAGAALLGLKVAGRDAVPPFRIAFLPAASAAGLLGAQILLFMAFSATRAVTACNIVYSSRALLVVGLMALLVLGAGSKVEKAGGKTYLRRAAGAVLLLAGIVLALIGR